MDDPNVAMEQVPMRLAAHITVCGKSRRVLLVVGECNHVTEQLQPLMR
jgi:hypothetical protein